MKGAPFEHPPTRWRAADERVRMQRQGLEGAVPAERLARRKALAKAVGDPFLNERVVGTMDLLPANFLERGAAVVRSVCRIELKDELGRHEGYATGILVGGGIVLTNHHVLPAREHARRSVAQFDYADDARGEPLPTHTFKLDPDRLFCSSPGLDYALVAARPASLGGAPLAAFGASTLVREAGKALLSEHLNVVQHPGGESKQLAIRHNELLEEDEDFLFYSADTDRGSSGSAVYNDAWVVVALHCSGVAATDEHGRYIDRVTGEPIEGTPASIDDVRCVANRGARVSRIYEHVRTRPDLTDEARGLALAPFKSLEEFTADPLRGVAARVHEVATSAPQATEPPAASPSAAPPAAGPGATPAGRPSAEGYADRQGYDPAFLGVHVPLPALTERARADAAPVAGRDDGVLDYTHFSLVLSKSRRLAFFVACNVDGGQSRELPPPPGRGWRIDSRVDAAYQAREEVYACRRLEHGCLVGRDGPVWGGEAARASADMQHLTTCSPRHRRLDRGGAWLELERHILAGVRRRRARAIVLAGPVFGEGDLEYRQVRIPEQFWKVVVTGEGGALAAAAYVESQRDLSSGVELALGAYRTYRVSVARVEEMAGLDFGPLRGADAGGGAARRAREVTDVGREVF